jgi:hypothetical protein
MKYTFLFIIAVALSNQIIIGQNPPSIQTDRPDQTESPFITPIHYFQIENGFTFEQTSRQQQGIASPSILTRFGIHEYFEIRLITEYLTNKNEFSNLNGIAPLKIGIKTKLIDEEGIIPTTAFIGHLTLPKLASRGFQQEHYTSDFRFAMQHTISENQTINYNLGAEWNDQNPSATFLYTLTTAYSLSHKIAAYIEFYGFIAQITKPDHRLDGGFTYLINTNRQLDVSAGIGLSNTSPNYFISLGYSFRFQVYK